MTIIVYTDPHLGLQRAAHTTPESKRRLQDALFAAVGEIHAKKYQGDKQNFLVCVGDFFDTYSNPEEVTARAARPLSQVDYCLSGNHDVVGRESKMGSLELLDRVLHRDPKDPSNLNVVAGAYGEPYCRSWLAFSHNCSMTFVPHVASSDLFEASLELAMAELDKLKALAGDKPIKHYLFLHCNYDNDMAAEKEATLNLTADDAEVLLEHGFDYIVLGHVHQPSDHLGGRVIVLGNTHPTGFGDLGFKRIMMINEQGERYFEPVYDAETYEASLDLDDYLSGKEQLDPRVRFAALTGSIGPERAVDLAKAVKQIWSESENLMALRSIVTIDNPMQVKTADAVSFSRLPEHIEKELADRPAQLAIWKEVTQNA